MLLKNSVFFYKMLDQNQIGHVWLQLVNLILADKNVKRSYKKRYVFVLFFSIFVLFSLKNLVFKTL